MTANWGDQFCAGRMKNNGHRLKQERLELGIKEKSSHPESQAVEQFASEVVQAPSSEGFKTSLVNTLSSPVCFQS